MSIPDRYPGPGDTCALPASPWVVKRAALFFDKVYLSTASDPDDYFGIPLEMTFGFDKADKHTYKSYLESTKHMYDPGYEQRVFSPEEFISELEQINARTFIRAYQQEGINLTPVFVIQEDFKAAFRGTSSAVYQIAIDHIPVAVEEEVSWEQVLDFRRDQHALGHYRGFKNWLRSGIKVASSQHAHDIIGEKLEKYTWSLKKHGLQTVTGALSAVITSAVGGQFATLFGASNQDIFIARALATSGICVWIAKRMIELKDIRMSENSEIALIHDARREFGESD